MHNGVTCCKAPIVPEPGYSQNDEEDKKHDDSEDDMNHEYGDVVRQLIGVYGITHQQVSGYLINTYNIQRGASERSVIIYCQDNNIRKGGPLVREDDLTVAVRGAVEQGARNLNPIPYYAEFFRHKLHMDQMKGWGCFGVTHVLVIDGFSRKMAVKNNLLIYDCVYRQAVLTYGMWDQVRIDHVTKLYLCLYMQERNATRRSNTARMPYIQTCTASVSPVTACRVPSWLLHFGYLAGGGFSYQVSTLVLHPTRNVQHVAKIGCDTDNTSKRVLDGAFFLPAHGHHHFPCSQLAQLPKRPGPGPSPGLEHPGPINSLILSCAFASPSKLRLLNLLQLVRLFCRNSSCSKRKTGLL
ncbi:hypothetical protein DPMN_130231 [Dreissena polymorpha]|uniref:Uncharacterized protein n=1 Tax=Dreissena polymorpha TaxID=45954 RepID=A0A9D4H488_DREPO|nr:hypothetical protein DPMN_130231 [Dreissena polymorpha]